MPPRPQPMSASPRDAYAKLLRDHGVTAELASFEAPPKINPATSLVDAQRQAFQALDKGVKLAPANYMWLAMLSTLRGPSLDGVDLYVGEVPDASFDARCMRVGGGFLILLHKGLALFLYRISCLFVGAWRLRVGNTVVEPCFDARTVRTLFTDNLEALVHDQHVYPVSLQSDLQLEWAVRLTEMLESFCVAHELGHVLARNSTFGTSQDEEFAADILGYDLYRSTLPKYIQHDPEAEAQVRALHLAAPHMFFHLGTLLTLSGSPPGDAHPPDSERSQRLRLREHEDPGIVSMAEGLLDAFVRATIPDRPVFR